MTISVQTNALSLRASGRRAPSVTQRAAERYIAACDVADAALEKAARLARAASRVGGGEYVIALGLCASESVLWRGSNDDDWHALPEAPPAARAIARKHGLQRALARYWRLADAYSVAGDELLATPHEDALDAIAKFTALAHDGFSSLPEPIANLRSKNSGRRAIMRGDDGERALLGLILQFSAADRAWRRARRKLDRLDAATGEARRALLSSRLDAAKSSRAEVLAAVRRAQGRVDIDLLARRTRSMLRRMDRGEARDRLSSLLPAIDVLARVGIPS